MTPSPFLTRSILQRLQAAYACRHQEPQEWERLMRDHGRQLFDDMDRLRDLLLNPVGAAVRAKHQRSGADTPP